MIINSGVTVDVMGELQEVMTVWTAEFKPWKQKSEVSEEELAQSSQTGFSPGTLSVQRNTSKSENFTF